MCIICPRTRAGAPTSFCAQQFSASTRNAGMLLLLLCLLALLSILFVPIAQGQTAHFAGAQTPLASGLVAPFGVAVDEAGNVYIADTGNDRVLKETLSDGGYIQTTIASGLRGPEGVAVDAEGNVPASR